MTVTGEACRMKFGTKNNGLCNWEETLRSVCGDRLTVACGQRVMRGG
jgi:hypothetical protein